MPLKHGVIGKEKYTIRILAVLFLLGSMASVANATIMLTINGSPAPDPPDFYGPVFPSNQIEFDLEVSANFQGGKISIELTSPVGKNHY